MTPCILILLRDLAPHLAGASLRASLIACEGDRPPLVACEDDRPPPLVLILGNRLTGLGATSRWNYASPGHHAVEVDVARRHFAVDKEFKGAPSQRGPRP